VAVDRPLDERQLGEVRALSTQAHITPTSFMNTYEWGDFSQRAMRSRKSWVSGSTEYIAVAFIPLVRSTL
jgi:hypothetical protein